MSEHNRYYPKRATPSLQLTRRLREHVGYVTEDVHEDHNNGSDAWTFTTEIDGRYLRVLVEDVSSWHGADEAAVAE